MCQYHKDVPKATIMLNYVVTGLTGQGTFARPVAKLYVLLVTLLFQ